MSLIYSQQLSCSPSLAQENRVLGYPTRAPRCHPDPSVLASSPSPVGTGPVTPAAES